MSLSLLYCEGAAHRPDIRVLSRVLTGVCTIEPHGSKYGLESKVLVSRRFNNRTAGIRDRDFDDIDSTIPTQQPLTWEYQANNATERIGWKWERIEIENYLIDPTVVERSYASLGRQFPQDYNHVLDEAAHLVANYTAARMALSQSRIKYKRLDNAWAGTSGGRHPFPDSFSTTDCEAGIRGAVNHYGIQATVSDADVIQAFHNLLPEYQSGGLRFEHYLTFFSGKDLLCAMYKIGGSFTRGQPFDFPNIVISGIERSTEDIWTWLHEWQALRDIVLAF